MPVTIVTRESSTTSARAETGLDAILMTRDADVVLRVDEVRRPGQTAVLLAYPKTLAESPARVADRVCHIADDLPVWMMQVDE